MLEIFNYDNLTGFDIGTHYLYLFTLLIPFFTLLVQHRNNRRLLLVLIFIYLWVLASFRNGVGADYESYYIIFNNASFDGYDFIRSNIEIGFYYLNAMLNTICDYEYFGFLVFHFIILFLVYKSITYFKDNISIAFALLAYLVYWYFISFNLLRICLAVSVVCYAIRFLIEKKYTLYFIIILSLYFIHRSSFLMVFPAFLYIIYQKHPRYAILLMLLMFVVVNVGTSVLIKYISIERYANYLASDINTSIGFNIFVKYIPLAYWFWFGKKYVNDRIWHICFVFSVFACLVDFSGYKIEIFGRLRLYSVVPFMFYIPILMYNIQNSKTIHRYVQPLMAFLYFMLQYYLMLRSYYWADNIMPYPLAELKS